MYHFDYTLTTSVDCYQGLHIIDINRIFYDNRNFFITFFRYFGMIGNNIFFVCSAWFLVDSKQCKKKKVFNMLIDVWLVSILFLSAVMLDGRAELNYSTALKCLLPTTFRNNWYITAYILFYLIHPALNLVIAAISKKTHLSFVLISLFLYSIWCPLFKEWGAYLYLNQIIMWVIIYFAVAYIKHRMSPESFADNIKLNMILAITSICGVVGSILLTNCLSIQHPFFEGRLTQYVSEQNLFLIALSISLMNLFRQLNFHSDAINAVSKLSLLVYIIHENYLIKTYYRPLVFEKIYNMFGYSHIIGWIFVLALLTFAASAIVAFLYSKSLQRLTGKVSEKICALIDKKLGCLIKEN